MSPLAQDAGMLSGNATAPKSSSAGTASIPRSLTVDPMSRFVSIETIGTGAFGSVKLVHEVHTKKMLAMKCLKRRNINKYLEAEIVNHSMLRHPHIVQFKEVFLTSEHVCIVSTAKTPRTHQPPGQTTVTHPPGHTASRTHSPAWHTRWEAYRLAHPCTIQGFSQTLNPWLTLLQVMEYANGGSLFDLVRTQKRLKETQARWFIQQLVLSLDYMHRKGIANRDIKLENCLLQNEEGLPYPLLKICDFGYSKADFRSAAKSQAPEVIKSRGHYDAKHADVWSTGVVLYIMLYGKYPFDLDDSVEVAESTRSQMMLQAMEKERYDLSPHVLTSLECTDFLKRLLKPDPAKRLTLQGILQHPWFLKKLPPHAQEMNDYYTALPLPEEHQQPEHIRALLEGGRKETAAALGMPSK
ncbi:protein kinase domain-containing protein [Haematococcus lacustris]|uniref:Protein kinase domain-containing protein n=1 Tax=Haematococcus lacustris TaxID=44745 RepID=A0A699Z561_HAELA|nr:protein kinase domain-containing protein [Haematococcus lacustris]